MPTWLQESSANPATFFLESRVYWQTCELHLILFLPVVNSLQSNERCIINNTIQESQNLSDESGTTHKMKGSKLRLVPEVLY